MVNPKQYKQKKKRAVDPNAPPRPNLMSHDKQIREQTQAFDRVLSVIERQQTMIDRLQRKYENLQQGMEQLIALVSKGKNGR